MRQPTARPGGGNEADLLKPGATLISFIWPAQNKPLLDRLAAHKLTVFAMDAVPRITRAQKLDALSAMANIAGYRAVVEAAHHFGRFFSGQVTAAGRVKPAQVLILGAGVAGLAAVAAAKGLGAVVKAFDTRPVVREQVESLGAQFIEFKFEESGEGAGGYAKQMSDAYLAAEQALIAKHAQASDIIISTALIPGKPAPGADHAGRGDRDGAGVGDRRHGGGAGRQLPAHRTRQGGREVGRHDRRADRPAEPHGAPVERAVRDDRAEPAQGDVHAREGAGHRPQGRDPARRDRPQGRRAAVAAAPGRAAGRRAGGQADSGGGRESRGQRRGRANGQKKSGSANMVAGLAAILLGAAAIFGPPEFIQHLTVFLLACVVGWHVIWNVTPALHTPLMSVTNAISGIIVIGGMLALYGGGTGALVLGGVAVLLAAINLAGGFLVTARMLRMFRK